MTRIFNACIQEVNDRGIPPDAFLNELIDWALTAPNKIFLANINHDIYTNISLELGPWNGFQHRKAVMLEVLRVLGGFESSWDWNEGLDKTNPHSTTPCTEEAGIFQCSGNSMSFDQSLKDLLIAVSGKSDCDTFRSITKSNHNFCSPCSKNLW